jgi:hypothetical protein
MSYNVPVNVLLVVWIIFLVWQAKNRTISCFVVHAKSRDFRYIHVNTCIGKIQNDFSKSTYVYKQLLLLFSKAGKVRVLTSAAHSWCWNKSWFTCKIKAAVKWRWKALFHLLWWAKHCCYEKLQECYSKIFLYQIQVYRSPHHKWQFKPRHFLSLSIFFNNWMFILSLQMSM